MLNMSEVRKENESRQHSIHRNTLTFQEAWEEIFEKTISKDKLYAEIRSGRIPHVKIGQKILLRRDTLNAWFKEQEYNNYRADFHI
ncbi:helix-turn-helix domain-containing protein [Paenibacillus roseipurpureus]|uniref:Helix-turn-helix domain-containing protein n=1 Tax=Paenibacillus roseopurpureus TaxID=2918901 RepID=A0AA96RKV2_9BACL|nr:helix-turn-helix domain-containing protein [Paenibacillus sp. MBLB1832]WNR45110.1 helix-turn-helix domain-containing protein [Paenibacillus sp. MBLB1832]